MRHSLRWAVMLLALAAVPPISAQAQTGAAAPKQISAHRDWSVYEVTDSRGRICYIASEPTAQSGNYSRRDPPAVLVARLPGTQPARRSASSRATPTARTARSTSRSMAARSRCSPTASMPGPGPTTRTTLIAAMKGGVSMTVRGTSIRDTYSLDTYSLSGFTAAYDAMRAACSR